MIPELLRICDPCWHIRPVRWATCTTRRPSLRQCDSGFSTYTSFPACTPAARPPPPNTPPPPPPPPPRSPRGIPKVWACQPTNTPFFIIQPPPQILHGLRIDLVIHLPHLLDGSLGAGHVRIADIND